MDKEQNSTLYAIDALSQQVPGISSAKMAYYLSEVLNQAAKDKSKISRRRTLTREESLGTRMRQIQQWSVHTQPYGPLANAKGHIL